jgi:uncharacterized protein
VRNRVLARVFNELNLGAIRRELRELPGVEVDVLTPRALPDSFRDPFLIG